ncbi:MAG: alpha/beta fold hydrolase BchO [Pseudomonadota bacterium]
MHLHDKPNFDTDGRDWPHRAASHFVEADGLNFHAQTMGEGPPLLLLHGTGASTHSFRALMSDLATDHHVTAVDLPGHGFTGTPGAAHMGLPGVAHLVGAFAAKGAPPEAIIGHSAGAAVALRMALDGHVAPRHIVGFNASLRPFAGAAGPLFSTMAKALFVNPLVPKVFAATASRRRVRNLLESTGSRITDEDVALYGALFRRSGHVAGALAMMAMWDLLPLQRDLSRLTCHMTLVAAAGDKMIPPVVATQSAAKTPSATVRHIRRLGHLAHEEDPAGAAALIREVIG